MQNTIKTTYRDTEISYNERENIWEFTLRGKERSAQSLELAKGAIDKPPPKDKKAFKRTEAYYDSLGEGFVKATITSIARPGYPGDNRVWVSYQRKQRFGKGVEQHRETIALSWLYKVDDHNSKLAGEIAANEQERDRLDELNNKLRGRMHKLELKPEDYD